MTESEINIIYDKTYKEYLRVQKEYNDNIKKIDDKYSEILNYLKNTDINEFNNQKLYDSKKLSELLEQKTPKGEYQHYIISYFESLISCRNEMICKNKPIMIYSYLFNLTMFIELVLKNLIVTNNEHFKETKDEDYWKRHDIKKIVEVNKENLINIGLNEECYNILNLEINKLCELSLISDIAQSFRYPIAKDFQTGIIKEELLHLDIAQIKTMIENHKQLLFIGLIIKFLTSIDNEKWLINNILIKSYN